MIPKFEHTINYKRARKNVIIGGMVILGAITMLSCVSSFMIYKEGFTDLPPFFQYGLAMFAVIVVEGTFIWLVYGFTRAFSALWERVISFLAMWGLTVVMLTNIVTHFMIVKRVELYPFQQAWLSWGAVTVFIAILVVVLAITLANPLFKLIRLELKHIGKQQETMIKEQSKALGSDEMKNAMAMQAQALATQRTEKFIGDMQTYPRLLAAPTKATTDRTIEGEISEEIPSEEIPSEQFPRIRVKG